MPDPVTAADYPARDPSLANAMQPADQPNPTPPAPGSPEHQSLFNGWLDFLSRPEVSTALLQFGASMLQPAGWGQTPLGQLGQAVGEAGQAVSRYTQNEAEAKKAQTDLEAKQATTANEAKRTSIAQQEATQTGAYQQGNLALTADQQKEQARHDQAAEAAQLQQIGVSGAGVGAENARTAELARQFDLQQKADAAKAAAAAPGTAAEVAERLAHAQLLQQQADAAKAAVGVTKGLTYAQRMLLAGQKAHMDAWEMSHNFDTPEAHDQARNEEEQRYLSQDLSKLDPNAGGGAPATTAPAAGATTTTTAPATPTPASGAPQPKQPKPKLIPLSQVDPAAFAAGKLAGTISAADENAFITAHTDAGTSPADLAKFMDSVAKEIAKQQKTK